MSKVLTTTSLVCLFVLGTISNIALASTDQTDQPTTQPQTASTSTDTPFNNENWFTLPHPEPASFSVTQLGEVYGTTTTDIPFTQINVPNDFGVRVQKFVIQDHYHYIVAGDIVYTDADLETALLKIINEPSTLVHETKSAS